MCIFKRVLSELVENVEEGIEMTIIVTDSLLSPTVKQIENESWISIKSMKLTTTPPDRLKEIRN